MTRLAQWLLAAVITLTSLGAKSADLVVWWDKGFASEEAKGAAEVIRAFEQHSGKQVELSFYEQLEFPRQALAALEANRPPDFAFGVDLAEYISSLAFEDRLADLTDAIAPSANLFDPNALKRVTLLNGKTGQRALFALPIGISTNHIHVWTSVLERAGFTLADIPKGWDDFWSFWCDQVQPAARRATGRDEIYGVGLPMSIAATDTWFQFLQFVAAYEADYVTPDGTLAIGDPSIRERLIQALGSYVAIHREGCTPPDSVSWDPYSNNDRFLNQAVVMTPNETLSIPNELKDERPDDYHENVATIEWPLGPAGEPFPIGGTIYSAVVFKDGSNVETAKEFVRFLVAEGWLAHYLNFSGERLLPSMPALLEQPFWLDPSDRHRMAAVMQAASRPLAHNYAAASGDARHDRISTEYVWGTAIHRIATEGISPEQAVDEAIARIKQILSE
jgi:multiple sugar transport system substrate-binding protein